MNRFLMIDLKAGSQKYCLQTPVDKVEEACGITIGDELDEYDLESIADFAVSHYDNARYEMGIDEDAAITFISARIIDETHEEYMDV